MNVKYNLPITIFREGKTFIAYTPALDFSTSAYTYEEVKKRFTDGVCLFLEELAEKGTLDQVLSEMGWQRKEKRWYPPAVIAHTAEEIDFSDKTQSFTCLN